MTRIPALATALAALLAAPAPPPAAGAPDVRVEIDWPSFLGRHDLVWESLPKAWHEAAFIGNGLVGATIYAEGDNALQWDVGRSDVTDRGNRLAIGRFALLPAGAAPAGTMRLDLWNAEARGVLKTDAAEVAWRSLTHAERPVTVIELEDRKGSPARVAYQPLPAIPARDEFKKTPIPPDKANPPPQEGKTGEVAWCLQAFKAGGGYVVAWGERAAGGKRLVVWTVDRAGTGAPAPDRAVADVSAALTDGAEALERSHRAWWHAFWPRGGFLSIPDTRMESFYWIQIYKLAAGTRADRPALDLMGPWFRRTPWPMIWWNLNIQLTYWPVYASNRLELGESLTRMLDAGKENLIANVPADWRADSAAIGRVSSYDCRGGVSGRDGEERGNLTWTLHNYWLQYRHGGDEAMLKDRLVPLLRRAVGYYLHLLNPGPDGRLHLPVSLSPEYPKTAPDTNYDLALLRWGLQTLLACDARLGLHDPLATRWRETQERLAPYPVDPATGYRIGAGQPLAESHRHFSHLLMVYPLHGVDPESAADRPLIERSLAHWIGFEGALQGYSFTGASAISSWLGRGDAAVKLLDEFLDRFVKPNTMYLEAGPVIETPLAGAAALHEVLLQSWSVDPFGTHLRVFPSVPAAWKDATIHRMLAEGAFEVSAVRRGGSTRFVRITSLAGAPCRVRTGLEEPVVASGGRAFAVETTKDRNGLPVTTIDLKRGETVLLISGKTPPPADELAVAPVAPQADRLNPYGSRKVPPVRPDASGTFEATARQARLHGTQLFMEKKGGAENVGHWIDAKEHVSWTLAVPAAGTYTVSAVYASPGGGGRFAVEASREPDGRAEPAAHLEAERQSTGGWDVFREQALGKMALPAGAVTLAVRSADGKAPSMNLRAIRLARQ
jgi:hypothetical protein